MKRILVIEGLIFFLLFPGLAKAKTDGGSLHASISGLEFGDSEPSTEFPQYNNTLRITVNVNISFWNEKMENQWIRYETIYQTPISFESNVDNIEYVIVRMPEVNYVEYISGFTIQNYQFYLYTFDLQDKTTNPLPIGRYIFEPQRGYLVDEDGSTDNDYINYPISLYSTEVVSNSSGVYVEYEKLSERWGKYLNKESSTLPLQVVDNLYLLLFLSIISYKKSKKKESV